MIRKEFPATICRLCGLTKAEGVNVSSTASERQGILIKITKLIPKEVVNIIEGDGLPTFICIDCERIINNFTDFCIMVQGVQERLVKEKFNFNEVDPAEKKGDKNRATQDKTSATVNITVDGKVECMLCCTYLDVELTTLHMVTHGIGTVICSCLACGHQGELAQFLQKDAASTVCCRGCHSLPHDKNKVSTNKTITAGPKNKKHLCEICSKSFRSYGHLLRHQLVHTGAKPYLCEVCGTGFNQRSSLKQHVLSHAGINPHKCLQCGQTFRFRVSLRSHMINMHGPASTDYRCDRCGKQFATAYKLSRHYRSHTGERPYECSFCGKLFSQTGNLNLHRKKHEEEEATSGLEESLVTKNHISNVLHPLLPSQQDMMESDPKFLETVLQHPSVPCEMDTVLLHPNNKISEFFTVNSDFSETSTHITAQDYLQPTNSATSSSKTIEHKNQSQLFQHFSHDGLLFIDQPPQLDETTPSKSDGVALPTFSSLQSGTSVPH